MRVENMVKPQNATSGKKSLESRPDKFTKELSSAINEKNIKNKSESLDQETKDKSEDKEVINILAGLFALPIQENRMQNNTELMPEEVASIDLVDTVKAPLSIDGIQAPDEMVISESMIKAKESIDREIQAINHSEEFNVDFETLDMEKLNISPKEMEYLSEDGINLDEGLYNQVKNLPDKPVETLENVAIEKEVKPDFTDAISEKSRVSKELIPVKETESDLDPVRKLEYSNPTNTVDTGISKDFEVVATDTQPLKPVLSKENINSINETIIHLAETTSEGESGVLKVKLYPEDLGTVDVTVSMESGKLTAKILVDNEHVRGLFANSVNDLREVLAKENVNMEKINIELNINLDFSENSFSNNSAFNMNQHGPFPNKRNYNLRTHRPLYNSSSSEVMINEEPRTSKVEQ